MINIKRRGEIITDAKQYFILFLGEKNDSQMHGVVKFRNYSSFMMKYLNITHIKIKSQLRFFINFLK